MAIYLGSQPIVDYYASGVLTINTDAATATADKILSPYTAYAGGVMISGTIPTKTASNITVDGDTLTVPVGYYAEAVTKTFPAGSVTVPSTNIAQSTPSMSFDTSTGVITASVAAKTLTISPNITAGYISTGTSGTVTMTASSNTYTLTIRTASNLSASGATVTVPAGYYASQCTKSVATGSATTPATTIAQSTPAVSINASGLITASVAAKTQSVTPTVTAGYVSSGTAGVITLSASSKTLQLTTKAATSYPVSTSARTIAASTYLTGAQTILALTTLNITAANIKNGVNVRVGDSGSATRIINITGTHPNFTYSAANPSGGTSGDFHAKAVKAERVAGSYNTASAGTYSYASYYLTVSGTVTNNTTNTIGMDACTITIPAGTGSVTYSCGVRHYLQEAGTTSCAFTITFTPTGGSAISLVSTSQNLGYSNNNVCQTFSGNFAWADYPGGTFTVKSVFTNTTTGLNYTFTKTSSYAGGTKYYSLYKNTSGTWRLI